MTSVAYHLRYFNLRARAEPIRWILKAVDAQFTEERIEMTDWAKLKSEFNFGKCPVLITNGTQLHQTTVICKYLALSYGLAPSDPWQMTQLEEIVESIHDISEYFAIAFFARLQKNISRMEYFINVAKKRAFEISLLVEAQITQSGWIRSEKMTYADLVAAAYFDIFEGYFSKIFEKCPKLKSLVNKVRKISSIENWILIRPPIQPFEDVEDENN